MLVTFNRKENLYMKIDLHVHTSEVSMCGQMPAREVVERYKDAGYDAIVITNHFNLDTASHFERHGEPDFIKAYNYGYELAEEAGKELGMTVLKGFELRFNENYNDYLLYGFPEDLEKDYKEIFAMRPRDFAKIASERDFLFYQAHPFRNGMVINHPGALFGIEVHNGHPDHDSRNDIARAWAEKYGLHMISGSDCHFSRGVGQAGIITDAKVETMNDLVEVLRTDNYTLI